MDIQLAFKAGEIIGRGYSPDCVRAFLCGVAAAFETDVTLAFDAEKLPSGFHWVTDEQGKHYLTDGQSKYLEVTRKFVKGICEQKAKEIRQAKTNKDVKKALQGAAKAMRGYVMRSFPGGDEAPIFIDGETVHEISKYFIGGDTGTLRKRALKQLWAMSHIVSMIKTGTVVSSNGSRPGFRHQEDHNPDKSFLIVGAKIKRTRDRKVKVTLDIMRKNRPGAKLSAYLMSFEGNVGFENKSKNLRTEAFRGGNPKGERFFSE